MRYFIGVLSPAFDFKAAYGNFAGTVAVNQGALWPSSNVAVVERLITDLQWSLTPQNFCLEMSFSIGGGLQVVEIGPRDAVFMFAETTVGSAFQPLWSGRVIGGLNPYNTDGQPKPVKAETFCREWDALETGNAVDPQQDTGAKAGELVEAFANLPWLSPPSGVTTGVMTPQEGFAHRYAPLSELLDLLAEYTAAQGAAKPLWGMQPNGLFTFFNGFSSSLTVSEGDLGTQIAWPTVQADNEHFCTKVRWFAGLGNMNEALRADYLFSRYIDTAIPDDLTYTPDDHGHSLNVFDAPATRRIAVPDNVPGIIPIPGATLTLQTGTLVASYKNGLLDSSATLSRVFDSDPQSYITVKADAGSAIIDLAIGNMPTGLGPRDIAVLDIAIKANADSPAMVNTRKGIWSVGIVAGGNSNYLTRSSGGWGELPEYEKSEIYGDRVRVLAEANFSGGGLHLHFSTGGTGAIAQYAFDIAAFRAYIINKDLLDAAAKNSYWIPKPESFKVDLHGFINPTITTSITRRNGGQPSPLQDVPTLQWDYSYTPDRGLKTQISVGQKLGFDEGELEVTRSAARINGLFESARVNQKGALAVFTVGSGSGGSSGGPSALGSELAVVPCTEACDGSRLSFTIPATYGGKTVTVVGTPPVVVSEFLQHRNNYTYNSSTRVITLQGRWAGSGNAPVAEDWIGALCTLS